MGASKSALPFIASPEIEAPSLASLSRAKLRAMVMAGAEALECHRVLRNGGVNLVSEVLRGQGVFNEYDHYPADDVYDSDSGAQYYYHAHRTGSGEHGHFHTFIRDAAGVLGKTPLSTGDAGSGSAPEDGATTHLIAISMDPYGLPLGLFATNRWVTGEAWYAASDVIALLPRFRVDHASPSWPVNRWIGAMMVLYRPHIEALLRHRDEVISERARRHPESDVFEDRDLEITGFLPISVEETVREVRKLAGKRSSS